MECNIWRIPNKIPNESIQKFFDSMPSRINAVIENRGYPTKY